MRRWGQGCRGTGSRLWKGRGTRAAMREIGSSGSRTMATVHRPRVEGGPGAPFHRRASSACLPRREAVRELAEPLERARSSTGGPRKRSNSCSRRGRLRAGSRSKAPSRSTGAPACGPNAMWPVTDAAGNLREPVLLWRAVCRALDDGFASWSRSRRTPCSRPTSSALAQDDRPGAVVPSIRRDLPGRAAMLEALGTLHLLGRDVRFEALHAGPRRVVPLPAHPWRSHRFELPQLERGGAPARDDWLYEVDWKLESRPASADPGGGSWLLLDLAARGVLKLEGVLDLRDRDADRGPVDLVRPVQALGWAEAREPPRRFVVTRGAQAIPGGSEEVRPGPATVWGFARSLVAEHPELRPTRIDLAPGAGAETAGELVRELLAGSTEDQVALRPSGRPGPSRPARSPPLSSGPTRRTSSRAASARSGSSSPAGPRRAERAGSSWWRCMVPARPPAPRSRRCAPPGPESRPRPPTSPTPRRSPRLSPGPTGTARRSRACSTWRWSSTTGSRSASTPSACGT